MNGKSSRWWLRQDSESVIVGTPSQHVYELVADMPRMGEWSPECQTVEWTEGAEGPVAGARFIGHNRGGPRGMLKWSRRGRVLIADPGNEFSFVTEEGGKESTVWRYQFESVEGATRVTESYQAKQLPAWARIVDVPTNRARELRQGMRQTLSQLKRVAESTLDRAGDR